MTRKCRPVHAWRTPAVGDDGLTCERCGRFVDFMAELTPAMRAAIENGRERHYGDEEGRDFADALAAALQDRRARWDEEGEPLAAPTARSLEHDHDDARTVAALATEGAATPETARAYRRAAERFDQWTQERGVSPLDALKSRDTVAAFLVDQPTDPLSRLVQAVSALRLAARNAGLPNPCGAATRAILARLRSGEPDPGPDCCPACGFRLAGAAAPVHSQPPTPKDADR